MCISAFIFYLFVDNLYIYIYIYIYYKQNQTAGEQQNLHLNSMY